MTTTLEDYRARLQIAVERLSDLRAELERQRRSTREAVAIVGMGCRLPPAIRSPEALFDALLAGHDAVREAPTPRFDAPLRAALPRAAYLDAVADFDEGFFAISPREAAAIDPQQRLLLEVVWEALERGAQVPAKLPADRVGVFVGMGASDYAELTLTGPAASRDIYSLTGVGHAFASGRLAYHLGLRGPCLTLDTACSSSLVALHLAVQSLRRRESEVAIAAGVQLLLTPTSSALLARSGALAGDGRCKVFDGAADGFVRGEGCAAVVLKRLSDALRDGDPIAAVIRGSACNQDGRSTGMTAPNVIAQRTLLRRALEDAGIPGESLGLIETHGTGTALGDPIELEALCEVFAPIEAAAATPIVLGALKSNLGHLEAAAGLAGVIKAAMCLERGLIPANLHHRDLTPHAPPQARARFEIPTAPRPWPGPSEAPRRAGVSAFGMSGTNAHVILEAAPVPATRPAATAGRRYLLPLSARSPEALRELAACCADELTVARDALDLGDLCTSAATRRTHFEHRLVVEGVDAEGFAAGLRAAAADQGDAALCQGRAELGVDLRPVLLCTGQGAVWPGMGRALVDDPIAKEVLERCDALVRRHGDLALLDAILATGEEAGARLRHTALAQPALLAVSLAIAARLRAWGVSPAAVIGHSVGELAAAQLAGALDLDEAVRLACVRGRVMQAAHGRGAMAAVALAGDRLRPRLADHGGALMIAADNGPSAAVIAGDPAALESLLAALAREGVRHRRLDVDYDFHGPQMAALAEPLRAALGEVACGPERLPIYSTVSGARVRGTSLDAEAWVRGVTSPVRFTQAATAALADGHRLFVEIGPHPTLGGHLQAIGEARGCELVALASLRRDAGGEALVRCLAALHVHGAGVDWARLGEARDRCVALPSYPWQRRHHWLDDRRTGAAARDEVTLDDAGLDDVTLDDMRRGDVTGDDVGRDDLTGDDLTGDLPGAGQDAPDDGDPRPFVGRRAPRSGAALRRLIALEVGAVLGIGPERRLSPHDGLLALGFDSMMAVELRTRLQARLDLRLAATLVFDHPTIEALALHVEEALADGMQELAAPAIRRSRDADEPIAIVGMACRFPGGANDLDAYWERLRAAVDATIEPPAARWDAARYHDPDPTARGKTYAQRSGFLSGLDVADFDAAFFKLSPAEAAALDPQQRLLLELSWEALEHGGQSPDRLRGSATGVFVGIATADYAQIATQVPLAELDTYVSTGNAANTAAGRLAYFLGLHGPVIALDTACSSSLVATHLAIQSLRRGEADLALAGGVNLILTPTIDVMYARLGALAPDSRCKAFDARADGMVRGEGGGMVVLARLSDALRRGDRVHALIRGSAINHDGRAAGLTVPNGAAQRAVVRAALADAGVAPAAIRFVETHGTGTSLGDPIEANALVAELGVGRDPLAQPLWLGAAKASFGHLEAAAGVVGLIKATLALEHRELPPQRNFEALNPAIDPGAVDLRIPTAVEVLPPGPIFAGLSAFGMSGSNAHLILESAPPLPAPPAPEDRGALILPISAASAPALRALACRWRDHLEACRRACRDHQAHDSRDTAGPGPAGEPDREPEGERATLRRLCRAAASRRAHLEHRLALTGRDEEELVAAIDAWLDERAHGGWVAGAEGRPRIAFVFSGHSGHWLGMGRELWAHEALARTSFEACAAAAARAGLPDLLALLASDDEARASAIEVVQPLVFAVQVTLAALWRHWGVEPEAVVGHSMGEIAAAHVAGALDLDAAMTVVVARSRLLAAVEGQGKMAVVGLDLEQTRARLDRRPLSVAAVNSPRLTVVSGANAAIDALLADLRRDNVFARVMVGTRGAGHSPQLDPLLPALAEALADLATAPPTIPFYSTVLGAGVDGAFADAGYWIRNLREPVYFAPTIEAMGAAGFDTFVEISPEPMMLGAIEQILRPQGGGAITRVGSLQRGAPERARLLEGLARLYAEGVDVDWSALYPEGSEALALPATPWQRRRHWLGAGRYIEPGQAREDDHGHPLLGRRLDSAADPGRTIWELALDRAAAGLRRVEVQGVAMLATATVLELIDAAAGATWPGRASSLEDLALTGPLLFEGEDAATLQLVLDEDDAGDAGDDDRVSAGAGVRLFVRRGPAGRFEPWAAGRLRFDGATLDAGRDDLDAIVARCRRRDDERWGRLVARGVALPAVPSAELRAGVDAGTSERLIALERPGPAALRLPVDAVEAGLWLLAELGETPEAPPVPGQVGDLVQVSRCVVDDRGAGPAAWMHLALDDTPATAGRQRGRLTIYDAAGRARLRLVVERQTAVAPRLAQSIIEGLLPRWLYTLGWEAGAAVPEDEDALAVEGAVLMISDDRGLGHACAEVAAAIGADLELVDAGALVDRDACYDALRRARARGPLRAVVLALVAELDDAALPTRVSARARLLLDLAAALANDGGRLRLQLVTRASQAATLDDAAPTITVAGLAAAPAWGLTRAIGLEHPKVEVRGLDLDAAPERDDPRRIFAELAADDREEAVAYRSGHRLVQRLRRASPTSRDDDRGSRSGIGRLDQGTALITGGLGGVGLQLAAHLADAGARRLLLLGRSALPTTRPADGAPTLARWLAVEALRARGVEIEIAAVDVGDAAALAATLATIPASAPLRAVFHCAGISEPRPLLETSLEQVIANDRAKVAGSWALHRLTADLDLDCFVGFSSMASVWGAALLGPYDGANHFVDVLAHHRRAQGLPALAINWGGWAGPGMTTVDVQRYAARMGLGVAPAPLFLAALDRLLADPRPALAIGPVDWRVFKPVLESYGPRPLLDGLADEDAAELGQGQGPLSAALTEAAAEARWALLTTALREAVATLLGHGQGDALDEGVGFFELGMDSVTSVALRNELERALGLNLPPTLAFEHPSVHALAGYLAALVRDVIGLELPAPAQPRAASSTTASTTPTEADDPTLADLSEDELEALLSAELDGGSP